MPLVTENITRARKPHINLLYKIVRIRIRLIPQNPLALSYAEAKYIKHQYLILLRDRELLAASLKEVYGKIEVFIPRGQNI
jgi:hypothetical protein